MSTPKSHRMFNPRGDLLSYGWRDRRGPGPWAETPFDMERNSANPPKFNGYIFKHAYMSGDEWVTRYVPKICKCMPLHPKTYGLACDYEWCSYCHPEQVNKFPRTNRGKHDCLAGRRGCKIDKMVFIKGTTEQTSKAEGASDTPARMHEQVEPALPQARSEYKRCLRATKWEASPQEQIQDGHDLAQDEEMRLYADGWRADLWEAQINFLAQQDLLEDFETEDADLRMDLLHPTAQAYTVKFKERRKGPKNKHNGNGLTLEMLHDDSSWDTDLISLSTDEDVASWAWVEESDDD